MSLPETRVGIVYNPTAEAGTANGPPSCRGLRPSIAMNGWTAHMQAWISGVKLVNPHFFVFMLFPGLDFATYRNGDIAEWRQDIQAYRSAVAEGLTHVTDTEALREVCAEIERTCPIYHYVGSGTPRFRRLSRERRRELIRLNIAEPYESIGARYIIVDALGHNPDVQSGYADELAEDIEHFGFNVGCEPHHPHMAGRHSFTLSGASVSDLSPREGVNRFYCSQERNRWMCQNDSIAAAQRGYIPVMPVQWFSQMGYTAESWGNVVSNSSQQ